MIIFEAPATCGAGGLRAALIGSCRVRNPISLLAQSGDLKTCQAGLQATHSMAEALQLLRFTAGELQIPDRLSAYIFDTARTPSPEAFLRTLRQGVDAFIVEVSDDRNFYDGDICFQQNFFSTNFVRPHAAALLDWFRTVCANRPVDEDCVQSALERLKAAGHRHDSEMADLLANIRYKSQCEEEIALQLGALMKAWGGRWIILGAFDVPGVDGPIMRHRRSLNEKLERAARQCGAVFYDPSHLVAEYGKATALDGGGADIYEFAPAFYPIVGERLLTLLQDARPIDVRPVSGGLPEAVTSPQPAWRPRSRLADQVNKELLNLHRRRLATLGVVESGLGPHYQSAIERETLVGARELGTLELTATYLPPYDAYVIMRAGLGELALLFAASGQKTIAYEPYPKRQAAIEAGRAHLEAAGLIASGALTIIPGLTPDGPLKGMVLGIGLDVAHLATEADAQPHFERLTLFDALLVDLHALLRLRSSQEEQDLAADRLHALGFTVRRDYYSDRLSWFHRGSIAKA